MAHDFLLTPRCQQWIDSVKFKGASQSWHPRFSTICHSLPLQGYSDGNSSPWIRKPAPSTWSFWPRPNSPIPPASFRAASSRRSEEHTSELQSLMRISYAVFCLQKKNQTIHQQQTTPDKNPQ